MTKLTRSQLAVVTCENGHLLVDAGAGSGKTTTVVQALCHQMGVPVEHAGAALTPVATPLTFEQVAAITFTNQAAADLKRKLRHALRAGGRRELSAEVDSARIGTIHGFCGELLRDFALRSGMRPGRRVLEEGEASALGAECALDALHAAVERGDVKGLDDLLTGRKLKDVGQWVTTLAEDTDRIARLAENRKDLREHERALLDIALQAVALRNDRLDRDGLLDFDRMIVAVRDMLRDDGVRRAAQQQIRLLVLDEFQDVDPAQRDIAFLLGGLVHDDPAPTRLILVGDPKQSIYRFRRADVTLWNSVASRFSAGAGATQPMQENFRSKAAILGLVDDVVGSALDHAVAEDGMRRPFEVAYASLKPRAEHFEGDHAVEVLTVSEGPDGKQQKADLIRSVEATEVARRIRELHEAGTPFGDVAILLAGWGAAGMYTDALRDAGIPFYTLRSEGFWAEREVIDCLLALRAIRDQSDDIAVTGFLKSPFVGVRDDTLFALARAAAGAPIATALATVDAERPLLARAADMLASYGALRDRVSTHALLQQLLYESGYLVACALDADRGAQAVANLRKLIRTAALAPDQSLGDFLRQVAEQREREDRIAPERLYRERADVVTITSVHSSKGLEWPVVFWCDLVRELPRDNDKLLIGHSRFSVRDETLPEDGKDPIHQAIADELNLERMAEAYRLWYVATTRAKHRLVLSGVPLGKLRKANSPASALRERFATLGSVAEVSYASRAGVTYHATVRRCDAAPIEARDTKSPAPHFTLAPVPAVSPLGGSRLSATQLMTFAHNPTLWWERYVLRCETTQQAGVRFSGSTWVVHGLIVHDVLQQMGDGAEDIGLLLEDAIAARDEEAPAVESPAGIAYRHFLRERVEAAVHSPVWQGVAHAPGAVRELVFTRLLADGTALFGAMDLASRDDGAVTILDVKTTQASGPHLVERYAVQGAVYSDAAAAIGAATSVRFTLLTVPACDSVDVPPQVEVSALVERLRTWQPTAS